jgi:hypothetical protein
MGGTPWQISQFGDYGAEQADRLRNNQAPPKHERGAVSTLINIWYAALYQTPLQSHVTWDIGSRGQGLTPFEVKGVHILVCK